jgi:hypothetical protein
MHNKVVSMLTTAFPSKYWFVVTYNGDTNAYFNYHSCQDCITVNNFLGKYNVFAVGVDKTV